MFVFVFQLLQISITPGVNECCTCVHVCFMAMYCSRQELEELENELYQQDGGDSDDSGANSELEFHLYSQLHYSSNAGEMDQLENKGEEADKQNSQHLQATEMTEKLNVGESGPLSLNVSKLQEDPKKKKKKKSADVHDTQESGKSEPKGQRGMSSLVEEVIVIDSSPDVISISEDDTSADEGVCVSKGQSSHQRKTSTPAQQVEEGVRSCLCDFLCFTWIHVVRQLIMLVNDSPVVKYLSAECMYLCNYMCYIFVSCHEGNPEKDELSACASDCGLQQLWVRFRWFRNQISVFFWFIWLRCSSELDDPGSRSGGRRPVHLTQPREGIWQQRRFVFVFVVSTSSICAVHRLEFNSMFYIVRPNVRVRPREWRQWLVFNGPAHSEPLAYLQYIDKKRPQPWASWCACVCVSSYVHMQLLCLHVYTFVSR